MILREKGNEIDELISAMTSEAIMVADVEKPEDNTELSKKWRMNFNLKLAAEAEGDKSISFEAMLGMGEALEEFIKKGGEGHSNPLYEVSSRLAATLASLGDDAGAVSLYRLAGEYYSKTEREKWRAEQNEGACHLALGNYGKAKELLYKAFMAIPDEGIAINLLLVFHNSGEKDKVDAMLEAMPSFCQLSQKDSVARFHFQNDRECEPLKEYESYRTHILPAMSY